MATTVGVPADPWAPWPHHGGAESESNSPKPPHGICVKNTFIDVYPSEESDSDEAGCTSPHRRNVSAPPSPTRLRKPWEEDGSVVVSDEEEEEVEVEDGSDQKWINGGSSVDVCSGVHLPQWLGMDTKQPWPLDRPAVPIGFSLRSNANSLGMPPHGGFDAFPSPVAYDCNSFGRSNLHTPMTMPDTASGDATRAGPNVGLGLAHGLGLGGRSWPLATDYPPNGVPPLASPVQGRWEPAGMIPPLADASRQSSVGVPEQAPAYIFRTNGRNTAPVPLLSVPPPPKCGEGYNGQGGLSTSPRTQVSTGGVGGTLSPRLNQLLTPPARVPVQCPPATFKVDTTDSMSQRTSTDEEDSNEEGDSNAEGKSGGGRVPLGGGGGPKRTDYQKKFGGSVDVNGKHSQAVTTMMLKNIPCRISQEEVMSHVDLKGFSTKYDFFYLPKDVKFRANLGYAFINFVTPEDAALFEAEMNGYRFLGSGSTKACIVVPAHVQGLMNNLAAFKRTEVMRTTRKPFFSGSLTV